MNSSSGNRPVQPEILDCTFRDGGYYTNWDFDTEVTSLYLDSVAKLPISTVEVGYLNAPRSGYFGQYYFLSVPVLTRVKARLAPTQRLAVMLDAKAHEASGVGVILRGMEGIVDLVRIAVAPTELTPALELAREVGRLGFEVGINIMYLSRFAHNLGSLTELSTISEVANTVSLVDSYGSCEPDQVGSAVLQARQFMPGVNIGFHGHDNMGLAFANSLAAVAAGAVVIDGTMTGMGRGAGNTRTEMLLVRESARSSRGLNFDALVSVVNVFEKLKEQHRWGTNLPYMISGASDLPQKDVMDWVGKNRYSVVSILRALRGDRDGGLDSRSFTLLSKPVDDEGSGEVLIVGGGASVNEHSEGISEYLRILSIPVIHSNFRHLDSLERFGAEQYICLSGAGVTRLPQADRRGLISALIAPQPPRLSGSVPNDDANAIVQVAPFAVNSAAPHLGPVSDTGPLALGLGAALALGATRVSLVGFDGYPNATRSQQELARETQEMLDAFRMSHPEVTISSLTPSTYDIPIDSVYSRLIESSLGDDL